MSTIAHKRKKKICSYSYSQKGHLSYDSKFEFTQRRSIVSDSRVEYPVQNLKRGLESKSQKKKIDRLGTSSRIGLFLNLICEFFHMTRKEGTNHGSEFEST